MPFQRIAALARRFLRSYRRGPMLALGANAAWCASIFLVPFLVPAGTVGGLAGYENRLDYLPLWLSLPLFPGLVYGVGDVLCHQRHWRTFELNGNLMPIDVRMTAIFLVALVGIAWTLRAKPTPYVGKTVASVLPEWLRRRMPEDRNRLGWAVVLVTILALVPAAADVVAENVFGWESNTPLRFLTGGIAGLVGGVFLGCALVAGDVTLRWAWAALRSGAPAARGP